MFQMEIDVHDDDLEVINNPIATSNDFREHLAFMISQERRNIEVSLRNCQVGMKVPFQSSTGALALLSILVLWHAGLQLPTPITTPSTNPGDDAFVTSSQTGFFKPAFAPPISHTIY